MTTVGAWAQPRATYLQESYDFGTIDEANGKVNCTFEIENDGDQPLVILGVYAKCGCINYDFTRDPIPPGQKGSVVITLDPSGREGEYIKSIYIYTNTLPRKKTVRIYSVINPD